MVRFTYYFHLFFSLPSNLFLSHFYFLSFLGNLPPSFSNASNIHLLLPILGQLIQGENVKVKALALRSLVCIMPKLTVADHLQSHALSIIKEYSSKDWFTSRAASGCMIPVVFKAALDSKVWFLFYNLYY